MSDWDPTEKEKKLILENSIERVINTTMGILVKLPEDLSQDAYTDVIDINLDNWQELKLVVVKLWERERQAIFKELAK